MEELYTMFSAQTEDFLEDYRQRGWDFTQNILAMPAMTRIQHEAALGLHPYSAGLVGHVLTSATAAVREYTQGEARA
jgi:hypothetical protein